MSNTKDVNEPTQDEAALLASVGGSLQEFDAYESQVLREATSSLAPKLTGIGFPDLAPLAPSYVKSPDARQNRAPQGDVPHILTILSNVTRSLESLEEQSYGKTNDAQMESRKAQILRIKRQMLLSYLARFTTLAKEEVGIDIRREARHEERRKNYLNAAMGMDGAGNTMNRYNHDVNDRSWVDSNNEFKQTANVLSQSKTAAFGKQALDARNAFIQRSKRKVSMMGLKRKFIEDEGEEWVDPEQLYRKRLERLERRRLRKGLIVAPIKQNPNDCHDESDDDGKKMGMELQSSIDRKKNVGPPELKSIPLKVITVYCCICDEHVPVPSKDDDIDMFLSRHMHQCQNLHDNERVPVRSTRKSRRTVNRPVTYSEEGNESRNQNLIQNDTRQKVVKAYTDHDDDDDAVQLSDNEVMVDDKNIRYSANHSIDDYSEEDYEDRVDEWIECGVANMREMAEKHSTDERPGAVTLPGGLHIPAWMNDRLFGYQRTALRWLWELHLQEAGGIVGDEMGLGKTVQVCSYLGAMALSRKLRSILIIAPATMLIHWINELRIWAPGLRRILIHKSVERPGDPKRNITRHLLTKLDKWLAQARADRVNEAIDDKDLEENGDDSFCGTGYVVVTTFESIRRSSDIWVGHKWSYVVLDEGQKIRNPDAEVTIACKRLRTPHRLLLSGTPIQNDLRELWSLFDFVFPGRLGTLPVFLTEFADPIKRGGYSNASPMQVQLAYRCALVLRDLINPYLLRRQKKDIEEVSRMPGKTEQVLFCKLSPRQRSMYEAYLNTDEVRNIIRGSAQCFRPIIMLRKICNHPDLICGPDKNEYELFLQNGFSTNGTDDYLSSDEDSFSIASSANVNDSTLVDRSGKLEVLAKILPLWKKQGHRVLIFSQWRKMLDIIHHFVNSQGWKFGRLDGNTNVASRQKLVDSFNTDTSYFGMLLTTKTGGVGLNLTGANRIILYDPDWNPQSDAQARERAWRFGQKTAVTVYRLITAGTIEEKIYQRQIFKTAISNQILQDPRQRRLFSQKDLRDLFTLKPDIDSVAKGGDGVTETGELTKGRGVIDADNNNGHEVDENKETLAEVLKSKGLAGIFDHDVIDKPFASKSLTVREMEHDASKVAARAAKALAQSSAGSNPFAPTWTGSSGTEPQRFGGVSKRNKVSESKRGDGPEGKQNSFDQGFGEANSAGVGGGGNVSLSSSALLAHVKQRKSEILSAGQTNSRQYLERDNYAVNLTKRIRTYIKRFSEKSNRGPSTTQILEEFSDVKDSDAALFKTILKQVATVDSGIWHLK